MFKCLRDIAPTLWLSELTPSRSHRRIPRLVQRTRESLPPQLVAPVRTTKPRPILTAEFPKRPIIPKKPACLETISERVFLTSLGSPRPIDTVIASRLRPTKTIIKLAGVDTGRLRLIPCPGPFTAIPRTGAVRGILGDIELRPLSVAEILSVRCPVRRRWFPPQPSPLQTYVVSPQPRTPETRNALKVKEVRTKTFSGVGVHNPITPHNTESSTT